MRPEQIRITPKIVEAKISSFNTKWRINRDKKGVIKTRLATLETVVEVFKADCQRTTEIPISNSPIYAEPMTPFNEGITNESLK